jgi:lipoprotein-anchoring transpeptidase ErfK/SrfK
LRRVGFILSLVAICALGAGAGAVRADTPPPTIADGVTIGTIDVSGLTGQQATAAVKGAYYAPLVVRAAHQSTTVKTNHFHVLADVTTAVQTALASPANTAVPLTPSFDASLIQKWVAALAAKTSAAPVAGTVVLRNYRPQLTHSHPGRALQKLATQALIRAAILSGDRTTIVAPFRTLAAPAPKSLPIIVIHRGINRLVLFNGTHYVRSFAVATGQAIYPTPLGHFEIVVKELNPWWYPPTQDAWAKGLKPVPPGPGNPLGTRWMGLSAPGVGIHGTDEPWSIGHSESHGCIRMQVPDAEWLYRRVRVGTQVFIVPR